MRTRKESLKRCLKLWQCMADNDFVEKEQAYDKLGYDIFADSSCCPACTYDTTHKRNYCGGYCIVDWGGFHCQNSRSPYEKWCNVTSKKARLKYVLQIIKRVELSLKKLEK